MAERLKPEVLKGERALLLSGVKSIQTLCQSTDSGSSSFLEFADFGLFSTIFGDNFVTAERLKPLRQA
jgi:hypothetical protein